MNSTDDVKHSLKLLKLCFFLILYVHVSGCIWVYLNTFVHEEEKWKPGDFSDAAYEQFDSLSWTIKWKHVMYYSMLIFLGNDIGPDSDIHFMMANLLLIIGAFANAHIFGTIAVIVQSFNIKAQRI